MMVCTRRVVGAALLAVGVGAPPASGQFIEPYEANPDAVAAFEQLLKAYRARPALRVSSTLKIELIEGDVTAQSSEISAEFTYAEGGEGIARIKGFTCYFSRGVLYAVHEGTDHSYYREAYDDSPYWPLLIGFQDLPYPHLAILWGEPALEDVYMQLQPQTPYIVPTAVSQEQREDRTFQRIDLTSPHGAMRLRVDPKTRLIESAEHEITGGQFVQPGTKKLTRYAFKYTVYEKPLPPAELAFDPGERQRVDMLASLEPAPEPPPPADGDAPGLPEGVAAGLVGKEAPSFILETADGKAVDFDDLRGKVVLLDFWATWCRPCHQALPVLHDLAAWARAEALPVTVLTVNVWESQGGDNAPDARLRAVREFWRQNRFTLPVMMDYTDQTARAYGVNGIPATFVIRSDGIVHAQHAGAGPGYLEQLKREIRAALETLEAAPPDPGSGDVGRDPA